MCAARLQEAGTGSRPGASQPGAAAIQARIGLRLRALRRERGLTLAECAQRAGLDKGFLSRVERGEKSASVGTLHALAGALGVNLSALLGETDPGEEIVVVRAGERRLARASEEEGAHLYAALSAHGSGGPTVMLVHVGTHGERAAAHHAGQELIFVLEGRVQVRFGEHVVVLERDDSLRFPGYLDHSLQALGRRAARALVVIDAA
ncbi:helix-turn-helix domain-containing protein [Verticiella sediminum]|uniref:Helix-turn-helix domain-containing protein n=1 Tax=Verticiella sediminum TaxID=1247510 RepID=A0A556B055_9BURK|nr:XRE family transcriptional regulator [Verticiella sediminum]TSH98562.1 helix-turn-helix domain-containing protein [Verticiella sediminum]